MPHSPSPSSWHLPEPLLFLFGDEGPGIGAAGGLLALLLPVLLLVLLSVLLSPLVIVVLLVVMLPTLPPVPSVVLLPVIMLSEPLPMLLFVILFVTTSHVCSDAFTCSHLRTTGHRSRQSPGIVS